VSFFAAAFLDGARALEEGSTPPPALLGAVARAVRRLHDVGLDHRDLHAGNLLVRGPADAPEVVAVDLHRTRIGRPLGEARRVANLAKLVHSFGDGLGEPGATALMEAYDPHGLPGDAARRREAVLRRAARIDLARRRSRAKRPGKESTVWTQDVGAGRGSRRRDLPPERIDRALAEHDAAVAAGDARVAKRNRRGVVTTHGDVVVKEAAPRERWARVRAALAPWRARAGFRNAHVLDVLGFATARPLAFVRRGGRTFTLMEDLSALPRLDHLARETFARGDPAEARALLDASARWVGALHRGGVYHGDLKGVNVRVARGDGAWRFHLIDTDRCRFPAGPVDRRRRVKNLAQLAASVPRVVSRADRLRWWRRYAEGTPWLAEERAVAREVAAQLARKVVVVDEPIE
jgi:tRNA A-37 threonylcarbamoyl transferase component Bud32